MRAGDAQQERGLLQRLAAGPVSRDAVVVALLARLSQQTNFSVGCYCEHEARCHRSILRELLREQGAALEP